MLSFKDRLKEPSTYAGIGLIIQGVVNIWIKKGGDSSDWATVGAGFAAIFLPEKTTYEQATLR